MVLEMNRIQSHADLTMMDFRDQESDFSMAMRRLAIIDLQSGRSRFQLPAVVIRLFLMENL